MNKLFGAAAILFACFLAALSRLRRRREEISLTFLLRDSLLALRAEIAERQRTLCDIFALLAGINNENEAGAFYRRLCGKMELLSEKPFRMLWRESVTESFAARAESFREALLPLGDTLGGSDTGVQLDMLGKAAEKLEAIGRAERETLSREKKLNITLSLCLGAFLVIMLM